MATQYTLNTLNVRLSQSPTKLLVFGVAIYKAPDDSEQVCPILESEDGDFSAWVDPNGEQHRLFECDALRNTALLQSAKHGNRGRDAKGALYGTITVPLTTDSEQIIAFKAVYLPHESTTDNDSFRFIGNPRNSRFTGYKFGTV